MVRLLVTKTESKVIRFSRVDLDYLLFDDSSSISGRAMCGNDFPIWEKVDTFGEDSRTPMALTRW